MSLVDKLKTVKKRPNVTTPVWKGPEQDGITFSLLSRFLVCRERFRMLVVEGLRPADTFNHRMEFGNMWHVCEEAHAKDSGRWLIELTEYGKQLCKRYPLRQEQVIHWYEFTKATFPVYVEYWSKHPDVTERKPLLQEQVFDVPCKLPSGRTVRLRGKWDSVDLIGRGKGAGIYLQENKTKSAIDGQKITRQLTFDLQTMLYLVALTKAGDNLEGMRELPISLGGYEGGDLPIKGVRYNVIRRSAHKSVDSMLKKLSEDGKAGRIGEWFARWKVEVTPGDVAKFRHECLDPILEQLCDWWDHITGADEYPYPTGVKAAPHWRHPFGVYNVLDEGGSSELDFCLETGSETGLERTNSLFSELQ